MKEQLIPQIVINWRRQNAIGLQPTMMMLWAWAGVPLGVYNVVEGYNVALQVQPQLLTFLSLVTWIQCYYYERVYMLFLGAVSRLSSCSFHMFLLITFLVPSYSHHTS